MVGAVRARAMQEADLVLVIGRKLDYQMGYGSPAVFKQARFIRIADRADELRDNRRGEVELLADAGLTLAALADALGKPSPALDTRLDRRAARRACEARGQARGIDGPGPGGHGWPHAPEPHFRRAAQGARARTRSPSPTAATC